MANATRAYARLMLSLPEPTTYARDPRDSPSSPAEWYEDRLLCHDVSCGRNRDRGLYCAVHAA